ncbi:MAG: glycosyl transferase [Conexibacteraceae bacterium]|nr:glycosyl transferase [Conexibacteraceae bacterium]
MTAGVERTPNQPTLWSRRFFLGAFGQPGHAFPMLALGRRLVARGHAVSFETWERWRPHVVDAGMEFVPAPEYPVFPTLEQPLKPYEAVRRATGPTRAAIAAFAPDVVVHDILTLAPALAAELEGVLTATLVPHLYPVTAPGFPPYSIGARLPRTPTGRAFWRAFERPLEKGLRQGRDELNETRRRVGLPPLERLHGGLSPHLCLVATFPQLEYPRDWPPSVHVVGPMLWEPPGPATEPPPGDAPLVVVAPSTSHDPRQRLIRACVEGLRDAPVRVLASLDRRPALAPIRAGRDARLVNWMSYSDAMHGAALVICHAGHGTVARALERGVPVLAVPHSGDMAENAARLDWAGLGVRLPWRLLSARTLGLAVGRALEESGSLTPRAQELSAWAAANDGPTRAAELIEDLLR